MNKANQLNIERNLEEDKKSTWKIDKRMLPYKVHYFLYLGAMGAILPYHPSIGISRFGLEAGNFAVIYAVQQFLFIVLKPLIGYAVDYFNNLKEMIVALTIINGIFTYLLLAIPTVNNDNFVGNKGDSPLLKETAHIIFCKLCPISNEIKTAAEHLPVASENFLNEVYCVQENNVFQSLAGYCPNNLNSLVIFDAKLDVEIRTCYVSRNESKQLKNFDAKLLSNMSSIIFIQLFPHWSMPQLDIVCPTNNLFEFQSQNFMLNDNIKACFKYPHDKITLNNINSKKNPSFSKRISCNESGITKEDEISVTNSFKRYQFWLYALFILISRACTSAIFTLSDTACYETIQKTGAEFGKQRAWGAIGWGLIAPFSGFLNDYTRDYWAAMILMSFLCALQIWNLTKINLVKPQFSQAILKDMKTILSSGVFIAFEVGIFLNGMGIGIVFYFLAWFITDIGGSRLLIGLAHFVQCFLSEVPFMILSGWLIKKVGHFNVVSMALLAHAVRFLAYSSLKDPWMILPVECLDGITFGAFYAAMTSYGKENAKPGTEATTQSILCSTYEGLGAGMGCLVGGACFDYFGGHTTFFYAGFCFVGASAINVTSTALLYFRKCSEKRDQETSVDHRC